jgi:transposase
VFYLPSYSPELNPDEYLNGNLKNKIRSGIPARNEKDIVSKTRPFMKTLQKRPQHAKNISSIRRFHMQHNESIQSPEQ